MRIKTRALAGMVAVAAAFAVMAVPAGAHTFTASKTGELKGKGFEEIPNVAKGSGEFRAYEPEKMQQWHFGIFQINCYTARSTGLATEGAQEVLKLTTKFSACGWYPKPKTNLKVPASFSKSGLTVEFHANGWVQLNENGEEEVEYKGTLLPTSAAVKVANKICTIEIPEQPLPVKAIKKPEEEFSTVLYSNNEFEVKPSKTFPTGIQNRVLFTNAWKAIKYKMGGEERQCTNPEGFEKSLEGSTGGAYTGQVEVQELGGNLSFE